MQKDKLIKALQMQRAENDVRWQAASAIFNNAAAKLEGAKTLDTDQALQAELEVERVLRWFLEAYWSASAFTSTDYFHSPFDPFNQCCVAIATSLAKEKEAICQILIPTVTGSVIQYDGQSLKEATQDDDKFLPQNYFLSTHEHRLIPILDVMEYASHDPSYLFERGSASKNKYILAYGKFMLTMDDMEFLRTIAATASSDYFDALKKLDESQETLYKAIKNFALAVLASSKMGAGNELEANLKELIAPLNIFHQKIWCKLPDADKQKIGNMQIQHIDREVTFRLILHTLLVRASLYDYVTDYEKKEVFRENIFPCTQQIGETLLEFCGHPKIQGILVSIDLTKSNTKQVIPDFCAMQIALENALQQAHQSSQGSPQDERATQELIKVCEIIKAILNKKEISNEFDVSSLSKIQELLAVTPPCMQADLIGVLAKKIKDILSKKDISGNIEDRSEFINMFSGLAENVKMKLLELYKDELHLILPTQYILHCVLKALAMNNRTTLITDVLKNKILKESIDKRSFEGLLEILPKQSRVILLDSVKDKIPNFVNNKRDLLYALNRLPSQDRMLFLKYIDRKVLEETLDTPGGFDRLFSLLDQNPIELMRLINDDRYANFIVTEDRFIHYISMVNDEKRLDFVNFARKQWKLQENSNVFTGILKHLPWKDKQTYLDELGNEKICALIPHLHRFGVVLSVLPAHYQAILFEIIKKDIITMLQKTNKDIHVATVFQALDLSNFARMAELIPSERLEIVFANYKEVLSNEAQAVLFDIIMQQRQAEHTLPFAKVDWQCVFDSSHNFNEHYVKLLLQYPAATILAMISYQKENFRFDFCEMMRELSPQSQAKMLIKVGGELYNFIESDKTLLELLKIIDSSNRFMLLSILPQADERLLNVDKQLTAEQKEVILQFKQNKINCIMKLSHLTADKPITLQLVELFKGYSPPPLFATSFSAVSSGVSRAAAQFATYFSEHESLTWQDCRDYLLDHMIQVTQEQEMFFNNLLQHLAMVTLPQLFAAHQASITFSPVSG